MFHLKNKLEMNRIIDGLVNIIFLLKNYNLINKLHCFRTNNDFDELILRNVYYSLVVK